MKRLLTALVLISGGISVARATVANVSADAHVNSTLPNTNFGTRSNLAVNATSSALVQFDFSSLPSGTTSSQVSKAVLYVYVNRMNASGSITVAANTSAWSEFAVTSATAPTNSGAATSATVSAAGSYLPVDITTLVQGWVTTPASNYGITLTSGGADVLLDSKENDLTGHAAYIDITLATTGTQGPTGPAGPAGPTGPQGPAGQGFSSTLAATPNGFNPMTVTTPTGSSTALNQPALLAFDGTYLHEVSPANSTSVAFTPAGAYAYTQSNMPTPVGIVSNGSALFSVNNQIESNLVKTIASSGAGGGTDSLGTTGFDNASGVTFDGTYVVINSGNYVYQVNPSTLANTKFTLGCSSSTSEGMGFDGTYYVVICPGQGGYNDVLYLYTTAGKLATYGGKDIELLWSGPSGTTQCTASKTNFTGSFFASDGVYEWVSCSSGSAIMLTRYNLTTYFPSGGSGGSNLLPDLTTLLPSGHAPGGLAFDGRYMWIADTTGGTVVEVDPAPATPTVVRTVPAGTHPYGLVFDGNRVWAADYGTGSGTGGVIRLP
jgi:hypothetical protein